MMKKQKGFTAYELLICAVFAIGIALACGWVWNVVKIIHSNFDVINGMLIARVIGVFIAPLGGALGFF